MLSFAIGQASPPVPMVLLDLRTGLFRASGSAKAEPVERALPMLFVLWKVSDVQVPIRIELAAIPTLLIFAKQALIDPAVLVDCDPLIRLKKYLCHAFFYWRPDPNIFCFHFLLSWPHRPRIRITARVYSRAACYNSERKCRSATGLETKYCLSISNMRRSAALGFRRWDKYH